MNSALRPQLSPPGVFPASSPFRQSDRWRAVLGRRESWRIGPQQVGGQQSSPICPLAHLPLSPGRNKVTALTNLPSTAQSSVGRNQSQRDASSGEDKIVLGLIEVLFCGQDRSKIEDAFSILKQRDPQGAFRGHDALSEELRLFARVNESCNAILDFLLCF